jgi:hypothetical protein
MCNAPSQHGSHTAGDIQTQAGATKTVSYVPTPLFANGINPAGIPVRNSDTGVTYFQFYIRTPRGFEPRLQDLHKHIPLVGKLDSIGQEVIQQLSQANNVRMPARGQTMIIVQKKADTLPLSSGPMCPDYLLHQDGATQDLLPGLATPNGSRAIDVKPGAKLGARPRAKSEAKSGN